MFWSIFLYIIFILSGIFILLALVSLFSPVSLSAEFALLKTQRNAQISAFWLHPSVLNFVYSTENGNSVFRIFWFIKIKKKLNEESVPDEVPPERDVSVAGASETVSESSPETPQSEPVEEKTPPQSSSEETVPMDKKREKRDNLLKRLKKNIGIYYLLNDKWRPKILRWLLRILKKFLKLVRFNRLLINVDAGVEEPVILGEIFGAVEAVRYGLSLSNTSHDIHFTPRFMENRFECSGELSISTSLYRIFLPVIVGVFTFPYVSSFFIWRKYRKTYRKKPAEVSIP